jgi:hypothetical protein
MKIYLDDDSVKKSLVTVLRKSGHDVVIPAEIRLVGRPDPVHLLHAVTHNMALLSRNYRDFPELHDLVLGAGGHHHGIILVREDSDPRRDMRDRQIVAAIGSLEGSGPLDDRIGILNRWR